MFYEYYAEKFQNLTEKEKKEEILWMKRKIKNLKKQEVRAIKSFNNKKAMYCRKEREELQIILQNNK